MAEKPRTTTLTAARLRELLHYDPATGIFTWKRRLDARENWNKRWAGKTAGHLAEFENGYSRVRISLDDVAHHAHRLAFLYMTGAFPPGPIDHADGNSANNSWANLRLANTSQNGANRGPPQHNSTGFKGVHYLRQTGRYQASIRCRRKLLHLGYYDTAEEAARAYDAKAHELFGRYARPNFPGPALSEPCTANETVLEKEGE